MCCSGALGFQLLLLWIVFSGGSLLILPPTGGWTARAAPPRVRADAEQPGEETFPRKFPETLIGLIRTNNIFTIN